MEDLERQILQKYKEKIILCKRYVHVDDSFLIWSAPLSEFDEFMTWINTLDNYLKFTVEFEKNGALPFLDLLIKRDGAKLTSCFYQKPTAGCSLLHYDSYHPLSLKINVAVQKLNKIQNYCSSNEDRLALKQRLTKDLKSLDYPNRVMNRIFPSLRKKK